MNPFSKEFFFISLLGRHISAYNATLYTESNLAVMMNSETNQRPKTLAKAFESMRENPDERVYFWSETPIAVALDPNKKLSHKSKNPYLMLTASENQSWTRLILSGFPGISDKKTHAVTFFQPAFICEWTHRTGDLNEENCQQLLDNLKVEQFAEKSGKKRMDFMLSYTPQEIICYAVVPKELENFIVG